jgi:LysR family hydrogen peroxide-inducible transcriptional activator
LIALGYHSDMNADSSSDPAGRSQVQAPRTAARTPRERPTVRQLEYLLALGEALHFRRAAELASISQPALSAQVQALEELLGVQLFERTKRKVLLTRAGREAVRRARLVLEQLDELSDAARSALDPLSGDLRLGIIPTLAPYVLPRTLPRIRERFPALRLYLREEFTQRLLERLHAGELDVLLLALPAGGADLDSLLLFRDPFLLALPKDHALAQRASVHEHDLEGQELLLLEDGHCLRDQALAVCSQRGAREDQRFRASSLGTLVQMVSNGLGLTLLPEVAAAIEARSGEGVILRPFEAPQPCRDVGLVWRRSSPRAEEFRLLGEELVRLMDEAPRPPGPRPPGFRAGKR